VPARLLAEVGLDLPRLGAGVPGDPGLFGPGSMVWAVARERVLVAAGPAALLMQLAHPLVAAGVAAHSDFRRDPFSRLRSTLDATLTISFGDSEQAKASAARVTAVHRRVRGQLAERVGPFEAGTSYAATDPALAMWVHATLVVAALDAFDALVRPLSRGERGRYVEEAKPFAALFGVTDEVIPADLDAFDAYVRATVDSLAVGADARTLSRAVLRPPLRRALVPASWTTGVVTAWLLPEPLRRQYGLAWNAHRAAAARAIGAATRAALRALPPAVRYWPHARVAAERTG
jgi:uncharacterized protein (DUF2236 family)